MKNQNSKTRLPNGQVKNQKLIVAGANYVPMSPRKLRLVAKAVKGLKPQLAIDQLRLLPHRGARVLLKLYLQAMANAKNKAVSGADLRVASLQVNEGPRGAKKMDKSHGARFNRGIKRRKFAHITLQLVSEKP